MKKIITILATLVLTTMSINFAKAEGFAVGVTGAYNMIEADGTETEGTAADTSTRTKSVSNNVFTGSVFGEYSFANVSYANSGVTFGVRYTPGAADVSDKVFSRTDSGAEGTGVAGSSNGSTTYKAQAEIDNYINYYLDIPLYNNLYVKAGWSQIDVNTKESGGTNTGTYGNATLDGINYGIGLKGENGNIVWKLAYEATNFDTLNLTSTTSNKIKADLDTSEVNLSVGYKF
jgi:opacity protein-like surface antigen